jgi:hypothetical protein
MSRMTRHTHKEMVMNTRKSLVAVAFALALVAGLGTGRSVHAWSNADRLMLLTFSQPISLPGVTLGAGTYTFDLMNADSGANVVRVRNKERTRTYFLGMTQRVDKPVSMRGGTGAVIFGEASKGAATPISIWYPIDGSQGHRFLYLR